MVRQTEEYSAADDELEWSHWREKALEHIRISLDQQRGATKSSTFPSTHNSSPEAIKISHRWGGRGEHAALVSIFLWEKNYEEAWKEAVGFGCPDFLWHELADAIAKKHPDRSYRVYRELVTPTLAPTNNSAYAEAIKIVKKMRKLASQLNRTADFN